MPSLDDVLSFVQAHPDCTTNAVHQATTGDWYAVSAALQTLVAHGRVVNRGSGVARGAARWHATETAAEADTMQRDTPEILPPAEAQPEPVAGPPSPGRIIVIPDLHVPYHDQQAWSTMLRVVETVKPSRVVIIGDFLDCYTCSSFVRDPSRERFLLEEIEQGCAELGRLQHAAGTARVDVLEGNHEARLARYVAQKAPELHGVVPTIPDLLKLKARGWRWHEYRSDVLRIGRVTFSHDVGRYGIYSARHSLSDYGGNLVIGHTHRGCVWHEGTAREPQFALVVGWLGDYDALDYRHRCRARKEWRHGFGLIDQDADGMSWAQFVPILDGRCYVDGRRISAADTPVPDTDPAPPPSEPMRSDLPSPTQPCSGWSCCQ